MSAHSSPADVRLAYRVLASLVILAIIAAGSTYAVRAAYGSFSDDFTVTTRFARAGQGLRPGSDVKYRGVNVGKVRSVTLRDRKVDVVLQMQQSSEVPNTTSATVRPKTLFGEKYIELAVVPDDGPALQQGDAVPAAGTGLEVEQLVDTTDDLLRGIDSDQLAILMDELVKASRGEGDRVARVIDQSVAATKVLDDTLDAQLRAIDSFARFARQYRDIGPSLNSINGDLNELLPTFNAARKDYERLLRTLKPLADHLAEFIDVNEADIGSILADGRNIVRVLTARKANISETIRGLDTYTDTLADAIAPGTLPDGSRYGHLKLFIDLSQIQDLLCMVLGPSSPGTDLSAVREALAARVPELSCPGDGGAASPAGPGETPAPGSPTPPTGPIDPTDLADPVTDLTSALATPDDAAGGGSVGDLLAPLLGGTT
ncbi:MAG: MCE-family protein Mce1A [Ilumatobacteraceae bacterium]|nr:MCE-family protein Mce1A [Ilumatobacteraceae bacterium]